MKKSPTACSRGKTQPLRAPPFINSKPRTYLSVDRAPFHVQMLQQGSERLISMSENPELRENSETGPTVQFASKEVNDCLTNWLAFLKVLRMLCTTGMELTDSIITLSSNSSNCKTRAEYCKGMWEHLVCATNSAAAIVRNQTLASLQEAHVAPDIDSDQAEMNQQVACSALSRLVNLQFQLSSTCCEWLRNTPDCGCSPAQVERECEGVVRCFAPRSLITEPPPQRRWSEAAAPPPHGKPNDPMHRRWSIPWKLALPASNADRSRSTTPIMIADAFWHNSLASQEELQEVISLLSCRPSHPNPNLPGVVLTKAGDGQSQDTVNKGLSHRGSWWGEGEELDVTMLTRKSSSSTDSSSCYSIHSRSSGSEELTQGQRSHLYSMWSGSDVPFIKLPESSESNDT